MKACACDSAARSAARLLRNSEAIEPSIQRPAADTELLGGRGLVAADLPKHARDLLTLRGGHQCGVCGGMIVESINRARRLDVRHGDRHPARKPTPRPNPAVAETARPRDPLRV